MATTILFLCTGNSCRSQMAEGWGRHLHGEKFRFLSAGTAKHGMNQNAVAVMKEAGVDLKDHHSKTLDDISEEELDLVITVCSDADENCPVIPGAKIHHHGFDDPPRLAKGIEDQEQALDIYRRVRDEIRDFVTGIDKLL